MAKFNFLNVFNIAKAQHLVDNFMDYADMSDDLAMIVAYDNTVWVCKCEGVELNKATLIQRIL